MSLSNEAKSNLAIALTNQVNADEIIAAIESGSNPQAATVAAITSTNLTALVAAATVIVDSDLVAVDAANPAKAEVDTGINALKGSVVTALNLKADNADVETLRGEIETRLDAIETKLNQILVALKAAGLMA